MKQTIVFTMAWPAAFEVRQEELYQPLGEVLAHVLQSQVVARPRGALNLQVFPIEIVKPEQVLNDQEVHWTNTEMKEQFMYKLVHVQSTLDISKLWRLFFTRSNYPECKLIMV